MTGRGIDQVLAQPCDPVLHESYVQSAMDYVHLAEAVNGPIPRGVDPSYIWGAALGEFERMRPDARIINLETSITRSEDYARKGINYRMSPENADRLKAAIDCCVSAIITSSIGAVVGCSIRWPLWSISRSRLPAPGAISGSQRARRVRHRREWSRSGIFIRLCDKRHPSRLGRDQ